MGTLLRFVFFLQDVYRAGITAANTNGIQKSSGPNLSPCMFHVKRERDNHVFIKMLGVSGEAKE